MGLVSTQTVRYEDKIISLLSPSFPLLVGEKLPDKVQGRKAVALLLETEYRSVSGNPQGGGAETVLHAAYVDSSEMPYGLLRRTVLETIPVDDPVAVHAINVIGTAWGRANCGRDASVLTTYPFVAGTKECKSEIKITRHAENAIIAVIRDVTERYRLFEAERRAHAETLARQKDAQSVS